MKNKMLEYISLITTMIIVGCLSFRIISITSGFIMFYANKGSFSSQEIFINMMKVLLNIMGYDLIRIILIVVLISSHLILFNKIKWKIKYSNMIFTLMIFTILISLVKVFTEIKYYYPSAVISNIYILLLWLFTFIIMIICGFKRYRKMHILAIITLVGMGSAFLMYSLLDIMKHYNVIGTIIFIVYNFILVFSIYFMGLNVITFSKTKYNKLVSIIFKVLLIANILINFNFHSTIFVINNALIIASLIILIVCTFIKKTTEQQ